MERKHLTDEEIQAFLDRKRSDQEMERNHHLKNCEICQRNLKYYQKKNDMEFIIPLLYVKIVA